jgi:anti-sigma regulatory factor (Ser/Thr protein kinase)
MAEVQEPCTPVSLIKRLTGGLPLFGPTVWTLPGHDMRTPSHARQLVAQACAALPDLLINDVVYAASELVTNAVIHTRSGLEDGKVTVGVQIAPDAVTLTVADQGRQDGRCPEVAPSLRVESGRGLTGCREIGDLRWECLPLGHAVSVRLIREGDDQ